MASKFDQFMEKLVTAYERGRLVPFIGAGMSVPTCPGWEGLIKGLEKEAGIRNKAKGAQSAEDLIRRAHMAVLTLRHSYTKGFPRKVERALKTRRSTPTEQTIALARTWWPLVLTTNYDNCFVAASLTNRPGNIQVLGRHPMDCQQVLTSLSSPSHALLWALQGYLDTPCRTSRRADTEWLSRELVIGHAEYRSVTHREILFRRAFAEVFRRRSMLFLGSGLRDRYLMDLFGEILEIFGPSTHPHYAMMKRGELSPSELTFVRERYQIVIYEYRSHTDLPRLLHRLGDTIRDSACREMKWGYSFSVPQVPRLDQSTPDLEVIRSPLPIPDETRRECLAVSAFGTRHSIKFSQSVSRLLQSAGIENVRQLERIGTHHNVARFGRRAVYAVLATTASNRHDLRIISTAAEELFDRAWADGYRRVLMQLLATGSWRVFPVRMPFIQILRAFARWRRRHPRRHLHLALHVLETAVTDQISSGRLDVPELLSCADIRFWVIVDNLSGSVERRLFQRPPETEIGRIREEVRIPAHWQMSVYPTPYEEGTADRIAGGTQTLESRGVASGSMVVLTPRSRSRG